MRRRVLRAVAVVAVLICLTSGTAHADPNDNSSSARWGWMMVIVSLVAGGVLTGVSMAIDCPRDDLECARWASLGIWSGIGVASAGAVVGLLGVSAASRPPRTPRVQVSVTVDRSQPGQSAPRATLVYVF